MTSYLTELILPYLAELIKIILLYLAKYLGFFLRDVAVLAVMTELTITQATERLRTRGIDVARRTVASWVEQGLLSGRLVESPAGSYWVIPASEVDSFVKPNPGRPPKKAGAKGSKK